MFRHKLIDEQLNRKFGLFALLTGNLKNFFVYVDDFDSVFFSNQKVREERRDGTVSF